ncbi:hypothetical protein TTHERM_000249769 (macronuclear) [Tetrahymena thermophila SB210]|uniref:Uncharacterized protein n=1 Tax=Tetrahymena thermophila (strain SB210) TaxID=312017 RepID=W7XAZ5_TETTS|nr:hypothetical protein TTHERM_000249769 [Tetrahymena thermophila SB210]EWS73598.1 hypothetical protein TTHERM_000249769 [Tetrahymena thermophila SB210]|eukprot:XP_012653828.1 hypothetical protein TTHERM_000249769 [Tetrahymena thermophila SB210]
MLFGSLQKLKSKAEQVANEWMHQLSFQERVSYIYQKSALAENDAAKRLPLPLTQADKLFQQSLSVETSFELKVIKQLFSMVNLTPSGMKYALSGLTESQRLS